MKSAGREHARPERKPIQASNIRMKLRTIFYTLVLGCFMTSALAQTVSIPDAGLDAAIRATLAKPTGPLTVQDLLSLTNLDASHHSITNLAGLEFATNLLSLNLQD